MATVKRSTFLIVGTILLVGVLLLSYFYGSGFHYENVNNNAALEEVHPEEVRSGVLKAQALYNTGHREQAISLLRSLTRKYPQDAIVHFSLGVYLLTGAKYSKEDKLMNVFVFDAPPDEGLAHTRKAAELAPTKREYRYIYAAQLSGHGRYQLANSEFEKIFADSDIRNDPKYRTLVVNYADALIATGQRERALEEYRKSLSIAPNDKIIADAYQILLNKLQNTNRSE